MFMATHLVGFGASGDSRILSEVTKWAGDTANWTFTGDDITDADAADHHIRTAAAISTTGSGDILFTPSNLANGQGFGVYDTAEDATFNATAGAAGAGMASMTNSWWFKIQTATTYDAMYGSAAEASGLTVAANDVIKIAREGSTFKIYRNGSAVHTFATTSTASIKAVVYSVSGTALTVADVSWSG